MNNDYYDEYVLSPDIQARMEFLESLAKKDKVYRKMFVKYCELEAQFRAIEGKIPSEYRDIIWDYFDICDDMTRRITELACDYIEF